ncbi:MAG: hypothetical protein K2P38_19365 [Lachnospiraceae bacterium]|nr:hypothetical protein [Lachnospiraceae bacterium]
MAAEKDKGIDYYYVITQAGRVEEIAADLKDVSDRQLSGILQSLLKGWKGENALAYLSKGAKLQERIGASSHRLYGIAQDMQKVAKKAYGTEDLSG